MATNIQLQGSFRGVPFGCFGHSLDSGRRTATHEFPYRDTPYTEDLGLRARSFSLDIFVVGDDVASQRETLRLALEQKGPGTLVHPFLGTLTVQVTGFTLSESVGAQRLATFSVTFVQAGKPEFPTSSVNPVGTVSATATTASLYASAKAGGITVLTPVESQAVESLAAITVVKVQTAAKQAAKPSALEKAEDRAAAIEKMSAYVRDLSTVVSLLSSPDLMSFVLTDAVFRLSGLGMSSRQAFTAYRDLLWSVEGLFATLNYPNTLSGLAMLANAALFRDATYTAIVSSAATSAVDAEFATLEDAVEVRDQLASMFELAMAEVTDDTLFGYLQDLKAYSLTQIPRAGEDLPSIVKVRLPMALPSLVLAHDLMKGSADEQRLIDLNSARNPWFVPNAPEAPVLILR